MYFTEANNIVNTGILPGTMLQQMWICDQHIGDIYLGSNPQSTCSPKMSISQYKAKQRMKVSPDDPRSIRTREARHEALTLLVSERIAASLTVGDVTQEAALHRPTFYLHHSGIPELIEDCASELISQLRDEIYSMSSLGDQLSVPQMIPYVAKFFTIWKLTNCSTGRY